MDSPNPLQDMSQDSDDIFAFLARIDSDKELREALNLVESAEQVAELARERGHHFSAAALLELFSRCNEAPRARLGLMDEKLIRVHLKRDQLR
ncbi:Nif11-like leader peptide family natural product precursor [Synechococcus sp. CBW1107]|nr:Nif11-like leader peptide family natural product precursor [Synechococcus sp. CBW1107]